MGELRFKVKREYFAYVVDSCRERLITFNINSAIDEACTIERVYGRHLSVKGSVSLTRDNV